MTPLFRVKPSCHIKEFVGEIVPPTDVSNYVSYGSNSRYDFSKASAGARQFIARYKWVEDKVWLDPSDIEKYEGEEDES